MQIHRLKAHQHDSGVQLNIVVDSTPQSEHVMISFGLASFARRPPKTLLCYRTTDSSANFLGQVVFLAKLALSKCHALRRALRCQTLSTLSLFNNEIRHSVAPPQSGQLVCQPDTIEESRSVI